MSEKEKIEMELVRRWKVKLNNIKVQNLQADVLNTYLQFIVGGDYGEDFRITPAGKKESFVGGSRGPNFKSALISGIEKEEVRSVYGGLDCEYRGSYFQVDEEKFEIEVWSYSKWTLNTFLGKLSIPLRSIAEGNMHRSDIIMSVKDRKALVRLSYTLYFQEIWDFDLTFAGSVN